MHYPVISLTTDFGLRDPYVAEMKAVILSICPDATIVDITHEINKFNVRMGAFILASASPYFPERTIHVAVVDPGVGMRRKAVLIRTKRAFYVGPDNGVLALAAKNDGIEHIYEITSRKVMLSKISSTFHGRDIFAPVSAHLAKGKPPKQFGTEIRQIVTPAFATITKKKEVLIGEVLHIDGFGNIITNLRQKELEFIGIKGLLFARLKNAKLKLRIHKTYADAKAQEPLAVMGSHGFLEISINQGSAAEAFKAEISGEVAISSIGHHNEIFDSDNRKEASCQ